MLWQNASARTVATARPSSSRAHTSSSSVRIVVAPSRCLQNDAKSCSPTSRSDASFMAARSSGRGQTSTWLRASGSTEPGWSAIR